jgi:potassium-transporting ATPase KdpC subunit
MTFLRQSLAAIRLLLVMTVLLGIAYPLVITGVAQVVAPAQANGSLVTAADGTVVGSALIGQTFEGEQWFQSRPSASEYSGETSGGSNLSPKSSGQAEARAQREADLKAANPDAVGPVPEDALTASASGLDPHISPAYALWQVPRIAQARGVDADRLTALITAATEPAPLGFLGQDGVNVTRLNLSLAGE